MTHPTGTVTFLFTDIQGSTKLWRAHPREMAKSHARHNEILCSAIKSHHGYIFQEIGDSYTAAFHRAGDALRAAWQAQAELESEPWGQAVIKVRMGIHTGEAELKEDGQYNGYMTISRTQRLMSAGHGGQVLISHASEELIRDDLPDGIELRDLGERRLKDLIRPKRIYQLVVPNLPSEFPALQTLDAFPNNLPLQLTSFIGREAQIAQVKQELDAHRLITLTGSGGTGKTRLSLQVAADLLEAFPNGVWFVELAPLTDPDLIPQTILSAIGISEQKDKSALDVLQDYLQNRATLIVLDNCEHLITRAAEVANAILTAAPKAKILATSREALGVQGELSWYVPSLSAPDPKKPSEPEALTQYEAVRLFIDRAILVNPAFTVTKDNAPAIAQICFRLDGIPLALELAAARVKMLSVDQISSRLDDRFRLLTGGARTALPRQQTLRAAIDWSYDLLSENERLLLRRLAVFAGGWTLELAEQTCSDEAIDPYEIMDMLGRLVDKSLVAVYESVTSTRYRILETVRQYAREKLFESGEGERMRDRHLKVFVELAEQMEPDTRNHNQPHCFNRLDEELDNFRAAMEWAEGRDNQAMLKIASSLWRFLDLRGYQEEIQWLFKALSLTEGSKTPARANTLARAVWASNYQGRLFQSDKLLEEAIALSRELEQKQALAIALYWQGVLESGSATTIKRSFLSFVQPALDVCDEIGDHWLSGLIYMVVGGDFAMRHDPSAKQYLEQGLEKAHLAGDRRALSFAYGTLGNIALWLEANPKDALKFYELMIHHVQEITDKNHANVRLWFVGSIYLFQDDYSQAEKMFLDAYNFARERNNNLAIFDCLRYLCELEWAQGNTQGFPKYAEELLTLAKKETNDQLLVFALMYHGISLRLEEKTQQAREMFSETLTKARQFKYKDYHNNEYCMSLMQVAYIAIDDGELEMGVRLLSAGEKIRVSAYVNFYPFQIRERDAYIAKARAALGDAAFEKAWAEGVALSTEEAVRFAIQ
jgi:predicted ATPase/class 3 adenylate cyclase